MLSERLQKVGRLLGVHGWGENPSWARFGRVRGGTGCSLSLRPDGQVVAPIAVDVSHLRGDHPHAVFADHGRRNAVWPLVGPIGLAPVHSESTGPIHELVAPQGSGQRPRPWAFELGMVAAGARGLKEEHAARRRSTRLEGGARSSPREAQVPCHPRARDPTMDAGWGPSAHRCGAVVPTDQRPPTLTQA